MDAADWNYKSVRGYTWKKKNKFVGKHGLNL